MVGSRILDWDWCASTRLYTRMVSDSGECLRYAWMRHTHSNRVYIGVSHWKVYPIVLYLNCGGKKVGNSGYLNPRVSRSERRCPTKKSDTAAAPRRGKERSYHSTALMSSTFRHN